MNTPIKRTQKQKITLGRSLAFLAMLLVALLFASAAFAVVKNTHTIKVVINNDMKYYYGPSSVWGYVYGDGEAQQQVLASTVNWSIGKTGTTISLSNVPLWDEKTGESYDYSYRVDWYKYYSSYQNYDYSYYRYLYDEDVTVDLSKYTSTFTYTAKPSGPITFKLRFSDNNNELGLRPESVTPVLDMEGVNYGAADSVVKSESGYFYATWDDLPFYDNNGFRNTDCKITLEGLDAYTNTDTISLSSTDWLEEENVFAADFKLKGNIHFGQAQVMGRVNAADGYDWPEELTLKLVDADGNTIVSRPVTYHLHDTYNYWFFNGSFAGTAQEFTKYHAELEGVPPYFDTTSSTSTGSSKNTYQTSTLYGYNPMFKVIWDDEDNRYGLRPTSLSFVVKDIQDRVTLKDNHFALGSSTTANEWNLATTMGGVDYVVPKRSLSGEELTYQMLLDSIPDGYEVVYGAPVLGSYTRYGTHFTMSDFWKPACYYDLTFPVTLKLKTTKIAAQVEWLDEENQEGLRPSSVYLTLLGNGKPIGNGGTLEANASNNWMVEWNAPYADGEGNPIEYTVVQSYLPIHYTVATKTQLEDGTPLFHFSNDLQEHWNYYLQLNWDTSIPGEKYDRYEIAPAVGGQRTLVYNLTINVNAAKYDVGQLQVRIPYALTTAPKPLNSNYNQVVVPSQIGVPQKPLHNDQFAFNYWVDDKGTSDPMDDELVFENWRMIEDSLNQSIEVLYKVYPWQMCDTVVSEFVAIGNGWSTLQNPDSPPEVVTSNTITYGIDTGVRLSSTPTTTATPDYSRTDDEYYYIKYTFQQSASYNQNHIVRFEIDPGDGELDEVKWIGNVHGVTLTPDENGMYQYPYTISPGSGNYFLINFWVKYPKSDWEASQGKHEVSLQGEYICNNVHENDKVEPYDYNDTAPTGARWEGEWERYEFGYDGEIFAFDKSHSTHEDYRISLFENSVNLTDAYGVSVTMNGYDLAPHVLEVADDALYMFGNRTDGTKTDIVRLTEDDYRMYVNSVMVTTTDVDRETGDTVKLEPFDVIIEGKRTNDGPWEYITTLKTTTSGTSYTPKKALFDEPYVAMRVRGDSSATGYSRLYVSVGVEIYADSPVVQALLQEDLKSIELHNYSIHEIYQQNEAGAFESITHFNTPTLLDEVGTTDLNAADYAANGYYYLRDKAYCAGGKIQKGSYIRKATQKIENDTLNSKVDVQFNVVAHEYVPGNIIPEVTASLHMDEGVFYDLLPMGYTYQPDKGVKVTAYGSTPTAGVTRVETVDNYKGTGRQLVKFYVKYTGAPGLNYGTASYGPSYGIGSGFNLTFWAAISWKELTYFPYGYNLVAFQEGDGGPGRKIAGSFKDEGAPTRDYFKEVLDANGDPVFRDINGDGVTENADTLYSYSYVNPDFVGAYQIGIAKLVRANSGYYRIHDVADLGGTYSYKLSFSASDLGFTKDLVLFDVLEDAANTEGHRDESFWKGSFAGVSTRMPESQGIAPVVYYSTRTDLNSNHFEVTDEVPNAKLHLLDTDTWSTTPPEDLSTVTAVAFDLTTKTNGEPYIFESKSATEVEIFMTAPEELPEAPLAYNRFSYSSIFSANTTFDTRSKHNIGHRVTVELQDLKNFSFIKMGQTIEEEEPFIITGAEFKLYHCIHECDQDCADGCLHTHIDKPGEQSSCWTDVPVHTAYADAEGRVSFNGLSSGTYAIIETATRTGFVLPENTWWLIDVVATYGGGVSDPVNGGTASSHLSFTKDETAGEWVLTNKRQYLPYRITKSWKQDANKMLQPDEIIVDLYRNNEPYRMGISLNKTNNYSVNLGNLPYTDPFGKAFSYRFDERPVDGYMASVSTSSRYGQYTATVTNTRQGVLDILKLAENGAADDVFTFTVTMTSSSGEPVETALRVQTTHADGTTDTMDAATNEEGVLTVTCKRDEKLRILNIPVGTLFTVAEEEKAGYTGTVTEGESSGTASSTAMTSVTYTNMYDATGQWALTATKTVNGAAPAQNEVFKFELLANGQVIDTAENTGEGIAFDPITYTLSDVAGSPYTYTVRECATDRSGYTADDTVYTVFVRLDDNGDGTLRVTEQITKGGEVVDGVAFDNTYQAVGQYTPTAKKTLNGGLPGDNHVYSFSLAATDDTPAATQQKNNAGCSITFDTLHFTLADAGKTYTYQIKEVTPSQGLLTADSRTYTLQLTIEDQGDGTLSITPVFLEGTQTVEEMVFNNTLHTSLTIEKAVEGPATDETFPFTIHLYELDGTESDRSFPYTGSLIGTLQSGDAIHLGDGQSITITELLPGMDYRIVEDSGLRYTSKVNGLDGTQAEGKCAEGGSTVTFTNVLKTTGLSVTKVWDGSIAGSIDLTLYANGIKLEPQPVYHQDGETYSYTGLPLYDRQGQRYVYSVKETYMDGYVTIYKNIAPHKSETDSVYDGGTIINREVTSFHIRKVWKGVSKEEQPDIQLMLLCNGKQYKKQQPEPDENGVYLYRNLPRYVGGQLAVYTVLELPVKGFETLYYTNIGKASEIGENGGIIVNTKIPDTSDRGMPVLWLMLLVSAVSCLGMLAVRMALRRRN